jgi:hypothetical protein
MDFRPLCALIIGTLAIESVVAQAPPPAAPPPQKSLASTLNVYVFPSAGQAAAQQSKDEGACYDWSVKETGSDPFEVQKQESAAKQQAQEKEQQIAAAGKGAGVKGGLGGAAAGALIGEVSHGDVGESAAIGAAAGAIAGRRKAHHQQQAAASQVETQTQQAVQADEAKIAGFKKAFSACLEGKKYTVKY